MNITKSQNVSYVEGGTFQMGTVTSGNDNTVPVHQVTLDSFYMMETQITFEAYDTFARTIMHKLPDDNGWGRGTRPVIHVSWNDALTYANWLSEKEGLIPAYRINGEKITWISNTSGWRLPTEAEWEFAARGGIKSRAYTYAGSHTLDEVAWHTYNSGKQTHPVGGKKSNELGLYDMNGNVDEWCWDWYGDYSSSNQSNPVGPASGRGRVYRGGSWASYMSEHDVASFRFVDYPDIRSSSVGFRLVRSSWQSEFEPQTEVKKIRENNTSLKMRNDLIENFMKSITPLKIEILKRYNNNEVCIILLKSKNPIAWEVAAEGFLLEISLKTGYETKIFDMKRMKYLKDLAQILITIVERTLVCVLDFQGPIGDSETRDMLWRTTAKYMMPWTIGVGASSRPFDMPISHFNLLVVSENDSILDLYEEKIKVYGYEGILMKLSL